MAEQILSKIHPKGRAEVLGSASAKEGKPGVGASILPPVLSRALLLPVESFLQALFTTDVMFCVDVFACQLSPTRIPEPQKQTLSQVVKPVLSST